jgi:hypothetical protein
VGLTPSSTDYAQPKLDEAATSELTCRHAGMDWIEIIGARRMSASDGVI